MRILITILLLISLALGELVHTPIGRIPSECVNRVPSGSHVSKVEGGFDVLYPTGDEAFFAVPDDGRCFPQSSGSQNDEDAEGWQAWTTYQQPKNKTFDYMAAKFTVPSNPPDFMGNVIFMFPGLQNYDWIPLHAPPFEHDGPPADFDIIQPVLQWGISAAGGEDFWGLASWYVTVGSGVIVSDLYEIQAGETVNSTMERIGDHKWSISGTSMTSHQTATITADKDRLTKQQWAYVALEVYGVPDCTSYPVDTSVYTDIVLKVDGHVEHAKWQVHQGKTLIPECPGSAKVTSYSEVTLGFK